MTNKFPILPVIEGLTSVANTADNILDPSKQKQRILNKHTRKVLKEARKGRIHVESFLNYCIADGMTKSEADELHLIIKGYVAAQIK